MPTVMEHTTSNKQSPNRKAVLSLLRLTDHLVNSVSVHGPPLKISPLTHCGCLLCLIILPYECI